jgi:hypothetical protein
MRLHSIVDMLKWMVFQSVDETRRFRQQSQSQCLLSFLVSSAPDSDVFLLVLATTAGDLAAAVVETGVIVQAAVGVGFHQIFAVGLHRQDVGLKFLL